jgi:hypothetical protein
LASIIYAVEYLRDYSVTYVPGEECRGKFPLFSFISQLGDVKAMARAIPGDWKTEIWTVDLTGELYPMLKVTWPVNLETIDLYWEYYHVDKEFKAVPLMSAAPASVICSDGVILRRRIE